MPRIRRVLIANRGEIAVRIARGARASGIVPLGIYSDADAGAMHVDVMDDAMRIGPGPATESYLSIDRVLAAAHALGADAVHPGYGFLSERATFAAAVRDAGLTFVGPTPEAIAAMGDKTEAKRRARAHDVPVVPGYDGDDLSLATLRAEAARIGTPLLVKASAGGGGRGMRVVADLATFDDALDAARREALAAFGDDRVLLERYVARPRHIEFQIVADVFGTTLHLGERECSIQRRHQKIVEEAPSIALDDALRERMGDAAIRVAKSVAYTNAGTVEFLLDEDGAFYFLEMNARLQVEHPVTEFVHGLDLVRLQFALAAGEPLPFAQTDVRARGWAIEVRVNAEDPATGYLPAIGTLSAFDVPVHDGIRVDTGVGAGSDVSIYYDSMLAKIIAYAPTRIEAIDRLAGTLARTQIAGVPTNVSLARAILADDAFRSGATTTAFLGDRPELLAPRDLRAPNDALALAFGALVATQRAWRIGSVGIAVALVDGAHLAHATASRTGDGRTWSIRGDVAFDGTIDVANGHVVLASAMRRIAGRVHIATSSVEVDLAGERYAFALAPPPALDRAHDARVTSAGAVLSPMPGKILDVVVAVGDSVLARDLLVVLEAMKMEHRIEATHAGIVRRIAVVPGELVAGGATLVELATHVDSESTVGTP